MTLPNNIPTERLSLDILTPKDYEFIFQLVNTKDWIDFIGNRNVNSKEEAIAYIDKILSSENIFYWVVRKKSENLPMGIITLLKRQYLDHFDIGFAFLPEFMGRGYAYEAAKEILSIVCKNPDSDPVLATTVPDNINSIKLLLELGFHFEKEIDVDGKKIQVYSNSVEKAARTYY